MKKVRSVITYGNNVKEPRTFSATAEPWTVTLKYETRQFTFPMWTGGMWEPNTFDATHCVVSDATSYESSEGDYRYWSQDWGYGHEDEETRKTFEAVKSNTMRLRTLLGDDYEDIIYLDEAELEARCKI